MEQIAEHYDLREIIGHGTSCTVRKVIKKDTEQEFAVKVYQNERLKAKNQIDLLARLDHPNIVNIYEIYGEEDCIILVLQYMKVGNRAHFSEQQVREYMRAIVDAVRYCHQEGVVHRDIKPENLLMTEKGPDAVVKLADFGISKILSEEMLNTNCGTPIYMPPEIWKGESYNEKVDVWSMGIVMYYLMTGSYPFLGEDDSLIKNIINCELTFPEGIENIISAKAKDLMKRILQKQPANRLSAQEVANHIWFIHTEEIPRNICEYEEVNLAKAVRKIRRNIMKQRLKKNTRMLKDVLDHRKVGKVRMKFLLHETDMSMTAEEDSISMNY